MIEFDPGDPFPLLDERTHSHFEAQAHAALVDAWLGFQMEAAESAIAFEQGSHQEAWIDLPLKSLLTPYTELRLIIDRLDPRPGEKIVDLGAAYGRMAFVLTRHRPKVDFAGFELIAERVDEGRRVLADFEKRHSPAAVSRRLEQTDLNLPTFFPPEADFYFMYDFGSRGAILKILENLRDISRRRAITVVGRGGRTRDAIERKHPWLSQVVKPQHYPHYSIYSSSSQTRT